MVKLYGFCLSTAYMSAPFLHRESIDSLIMTARPHANQVSGWCETKNLVCLAKLTAHEFWTAVTKKGSPPDAPSEFRRKRAALIKAHYYSLEYRCYLFPDYTEEGGLPSIKLAVYSNIQLKKCQLWAIISKQNSNVLKFHWLVSLVSLQLNVECCYSHYAEPHDLYISSPGHSPAVSWAISWLARQATVS